ncbi:hypothetical protein [Pedobacter sp. SYSU D00535]|uniref:hypothetical protein n=1 Tax=Pedobacter sp. SYSU D00535 TaxID=2810308 RepID=UPI001A97BFF9|nr:hypothetical protein [Pedobacter sp. SYSU D00535]
MKKFILTILLTAFMLVDMKAQISEGNVMIGGNISNLSLGLDEPNVFTLSLNPKAAWFVSDGVALGGELSFGLATAKDAGTDLNYGIGALGRYYGTRGANTVLNNSRFFGEATVGISGVNPAFGDNTNGLGFSFGPGFSYFVTPSVGLEALVKYNGVLGFGSSAYGHNLGLNFGLQVYLPGRRTAATIERDTR